MRRLIPALGVAAALIASPALADDAAVAKLVADYEAFWLKEDPFTAGRLGDRAALARLPEVTPEADARRKAALEGFRTRLAAIPDAGLTDEARLNRDLLRWTVDASLARIGFDDARMPISSDGGFFDTLDYFGSITPVRTRDDALAWIGRLEAAPKHWRNNVANVRRGVKTGFTQPRTTTEAVIKLLKERQATPSADDPLLKPLAKLPDTIPAAEQAQLRARAQAAADAMRPLRAEFIGYLEKDYLPASRKGVGARSLPNGEAYYRFVVRDHTTTELSPDQIHELGKSEVARIRARMEVVMKEAGWTGDFPGFLNKLRTDPQFYATSREDLLEKASEIAKRIDDQLPGYFGTLPRLTYGVRPVPKEIEAGYTTGRYFQGSPEQGVAGGYMVNTYALNQRALYELPALTAHEAVPGHHLQIALAQELDGVPAFRREGGYSAYVEGWGLYSEKVAGEMGIYRTPYERFGQLSYEMWRACRLVADTGLHWKGWSVEQAKSCFLENSALSPLNIDVELARYVSWPGQALAYKIGELTYVRLREKAKTTLGDQFDIRRFHDAVLLAGPVPMSVLEARVDAWIATQGGLSSRR
jgi:uncharacterized protein (DUF885 family)